MKIERTLRAWRNIIVKVVTDEDIEDMEWAAILEDHGDEYLVVRTKDKKTYKYGCFANLKYAYIELNLLMKKPEMYAEDRAETSNDIYWLVHNNLFEKVGGFNSEKIRKCHDESYAQFRFDLFIERLNEIHEESKYRYDSNSHKTEAMDFLVENSIDTEENIEKINSAHWDSRIDGVDGIAGKKDISNYDQLYFESIGDVYVVDKEDLEIVEDYETDEWGFRVYYLNVEPDPRLNANKKLQKLVYDEVDDDDKYWWEDWMNNTEVTLSDSISVLYDKTFVDEETGEALYLVIDRSDNRPVASYLDADEILRLLGKEDKNDEDGGF